jgi:hypothetical protein
LPCHTSLSFPELWFSPSTRVLLRGTRTNSWLRAESSINAQPPTCFSKSL